MQNQIKAHVLGIRRGTVDGNKYASLYILEEADPAKSADEAGKMPIKVTCSHDILDKVASEKMQLPGDFDVLIKVNMGAGGKATMVATDLRPNK
ncbi:MAG: hypothetical protein OQK94_11720, partial [Gammaproteobacteria bacterium]|nr:hypothetical protein [Gammaproteobacteria bacterium]